MYLLPCDLKVLSNVPNVLSTRSAAKSSATCNGFTASLQQKYRRCNTASYNFQSSRLSLRAQPQLQVKAEAKTSTSSEAEGSLDRKEVDLKPVELTPEAFRPFGQVCSAQEDGDLYGPNDAQLVLNGTPRFYIMKLPARGMCFDSLAHHSKCTQCLSSVQQKPWYIAVAANTVKTPTTDDITVFEVPPGTFIKLERATWHAGPLFPDDERDFYNLELSDTNVTDGTWSDPADNQNILYNVVL